MGDAFLLRNISYEGTPRRMLMQNSGGRSPILAICNILILRGDLTFDASKSSVTLGDMLSGLFRVLFTKNDASSKPAAEISAKRAQYFKASYESCVKFLPLFNRKFTVNVRFGGPKDVEYTRGLCLFAFLDIDLVHGWVVWQDDSYSHSLIASSCRTALEERSTMLDDPQSRKSLSETDRKALEIEVGVIKEFLEVTVSQLTTEGLNRLNSDLQDKELVVYYQDGEFGVLTKRNGKLHLLCTDMDDLTGENDCAVWELFGEAVDDACFFDSEFNLCT